MYTDQLVQAPFGVSVFGSAILEAEPDAVSIYCAVSALQEHPRDAFREVRDAAQRVRRYLDETQIEDVRMSRVTIDQTIRFMGGEQKFMGYTARIGFHLLLRHLDMMEEFLSGIVDAGVNEISRVDFETSRLKEIRAEARRQAIQAAYEKAENYCRAADVHLGQVIHIEDMNPDMLNVGEGHRGAGARMLEMENFQAMEPGKISVGAAVAVAFAIEKRHPRSSRGQDVGASK